MTRYTVKVAKSGQKIAVFCDGEFQRHIEASDDTFVPANARKFAEGLFVALNKEAEQMTDTKAEPSVTTKAEEQQESISEVVNEEAKGEGADAKMASLEEENRQLRTRLAKQQYESQIERKARRGLAIAKEEVSLGKVANSQDSVEARVMEITAMSDDQIDILERKTAGLEAFDSIESAETYANRMKIASRMYRKAAEDSMEEKDEESAIKAEKQADICEAEFKLASDFIATSKKASDDGDEDDEIEVESKKASDDGDEDDEIKVESKKASDDGDEDDEIEVESKKASDDGDEDDEIEVESKKASNPDFAPEDIEEKVDEQAIGEAPHMPNASKELVDLYTKIANIHEKIAEEAKAEGEEAVAEEANLEAKESRKKAQILSTAGEENEGMDKAVMASELVDAYSKLAEILDKTATQAEEDGQEDVADEADMEASSCKRKANLLMSAGSDEDEGIENTAETEEEDMEKESAQESENSVSKSAGVQKLASVEANQSAPESSLDDLSTSLWGSKYADLK